MRPGVSPARKAAVSASNIAAASAIVALAALGGFPDLAAAAAPEWVGPTKLVLDPLLLFFEFAFVARIILSWYPAVSSWPAGDGDGGSGGGVAEGGGLVLTS